jgi:hypothetical protein
MIHQPGLFVSTKKMFIKRFKYFGALHLMSHFSNFYLQIFRGSAAI